MNPPKKEHSLDFFIIPPYYTPDKKMTFLAGEPNGKTETKTQDWQQKTSYALENPAQNQLSRRFFTA
ncbi:MAG: hypothetical protein WHS88_04965 [Anaerohalosphaeraceae bacterium]